MSGSTEEFHHFVEAHTCSQIVSLSWFLFSIKPNNGALKSLILGEVK